MMYCVIFASGGDYASGMWLYLSELDLLALKEKLTAAYQFFLYDRTIDFLGWSDSVGVITETSETGGPFEYQEESPEDCPYVVCSEMRVDAYTATRDTPPRLIRLSWSRKHQDIDYCVVFDPEEMLQQLRDAAGDSA